MKKIDETRKRLTEHLNKRIKCDSKDVDPKDILQNKEEILSQSLKGTKLKTSFHHKENNVQFPSPDAVEIETSPVKAETVVQKAALNKKANQI